MAQIREIRSGKALQSQTLRDAFDDAPTHALIQRLLLQPAIKVRLCRERGGDLDSARVRALVWHDLVHHAPLLGGLGIDGVAGLQQPLGSRGADNFFPHRLQTVAAGDA